MKQVFPSSPQSKQEKVRKIGIPKYPWETINNGESFSVGYNEIKIESLRPLVSRMAKRYNKIFRVVDHGPEVGYEVACKGIRQATNVVEALKAQKVVNEFGGMEFDENGRVIEKENEK